MKILIVFQSTYGDTFFRKTFQDHLFSFKRYARAEVFYHNSYFNPTNFIINQSYDLIVFHYSFMAIKWSCSGELLRHKWIEKLKGKKVIICQDEYINAIEVNKFISKYGIKHIFSCCDNDQDKNTIYPNFKSRGIKITSVLPGYVEAKYLKGKSKKKPHKKRNIDIFYRARSNSYFLGFFSLRKKSIAELFLNNRFHDIRIDISTKEKDTITGNQWFKKLEDSRICLGVEGGASAFDEDGMLKHNVQEFVKSNPDVTFEDVSHRIIKDKDFKLNYKTISPRSFEACITKTCQVLMEGNYSGVLKKDRHYISLNKDYSNFKDVIDKINNVDYCEKIANLAYQEVALNSKYSYKYFVEKTLFESIENNKNNKTNETLKCKFINFIYLSFLPFIIYYVRKIWK